MKRLKLFIAIFCLAVSLPMAFVIWQTYTGLAQEERSQMQFFCETLFDSMEAELASLVQREESRAVDEYRHTLADQGQPAPLSPLARQPTGTYILGYLQNNPDGSFQTPLVADLENVADHQSTIIDQLTSINARFNQKKFTVPSKHAIPEAAARPDAQPTMEKKSKASFADRYIARPSPKSAQRYLGKKKVQRTEEITADQAFNFSRESQSILDQSQRLEAPAAEKDSEKETMALAPRPRSNTMPSESTGSLTGARHFQVEVAPLQSVAIDNDHYFIFRRIAINNQIYRQGFVLRIKPFLTHLAATHFQPQPMATFSQLNLYVMTNGRRSDPIQFGATAQETRFSTQRTFPAPFDFMRAAVHADAVPTSPARRTLNVALIALGLFMLLGLFGLYQSTRAMVELSERRSQFVSSVTHELKTPLTNIRMYIEMLEQGIAATPEREQDYFRILGSESTRLSRLINNVLELAKLEKKQRIFDLQEGHLQEVLVEVKAIMAHKLEQEGFTLKMNTPGLPPFAFDREVLIQILINLIENSVKFGRSSQQRHITFAAHRDEDWIQIAVSDQGPGIPKRSLKKIFDDFYRVDNNLTRTTGGTGIGLALVKKFVTALGGRIHAVNNPGAGCTITLVLPLHPKKT